MVKEIGGRIPLEDLAAAVDKKTRLLAISHVEFASGFRHDLGRIGELCRKRRAIFLVDPIQGLGALPFNAAEMGIDIVATGGHKWLLAPEGIGLLCVRPDLMDRIEPLSVGASSVRDSGSYLSYDPTLRPTAERYECGTINMCGAFGLGAAIEFLRSVRIARIAAEIRKVTDHLCNGLPRKGYKLFSPRGEGEWSGILSFETKGLDPGAVALRLKEAGVIVAAREGRLRASPHFYNTIEEADRLLEALP